MVKIVHARLNENGQVMHGIPGDQTGQEVVKQDFYEGNWTYIFRPKSEQLAMKMVAHAEDIAKNDNIGYGQDDRYSMYEAAKKVNWNFSKIATKCSCDCSQLVSCVINASGVEITPYLFTWNMLTYMRPMSEFITIPYNKGMFLKAGDIVLKTGHVVIVVEGDDTDYPEWVGECYGAALVPVYADPEENDHRCTWPTLGTGNLFGVIGEDGAFYKIRIAEKHVGYILKPYVLRKTPIKTMKVIGDVYVRTNPGANYRSIGVLHTGEEVVVCDTKKAANGADWYYIRLGDGFGFSSSKFIK